MRQNGAIDVDGVPIGHAIKVAFCDDPQCSHVHVLIEDADQKVIAVCTADWSTVRTLQNALYELAAGQS